MISLSGIPFLRFTIAFISGILFYIFIQPAKDFLFITIGSFAVYLMLFLITRVRRHAFYSLRPWLGLSAMITLFFFGLLFTRHHDEHYKPNHLLNISQPLTGYEAMVTSGPEEKDKTFKLDVSLEKGYFGDTLFPLQGTVIIYVSKKNYKQLYYGDKLLIRGLPQRALAPLNPYEFDYCNYLKFHHIYHTHFLNGGDYIVRGSNQGNSVIALSYFLRERSEAILRKYIHGKHELGIAGALLLGIKGSMDEEMKEIYSSTGTTHVLAVSGMHVIIVLQLLGLFFQPFRSSRFQRFLLPVIFLISLVFYVMLTGFSSSVLRAAIMVSLTVIAGVLGRNISIFSAIAVSAFTLLCYDPYMIMDAGFQLSYLALIGIVCFTDKIYHLLDFKHYISDYVWKLTSVTLAAQITTLPITLFYFHQIPVAFLVSNIMAVFLSECILYAGMFLLTFCFIPLLPDLLGFVIGKLIFLMNYLLILIHKIPFSKVQGIMLPFHEVLLLYAVIISLTLFLRNKSLNYFLASCVLIGILVCSSVIQSIQTKNQSSVVMFNIRDHQAVAVINGEEAVLIADSLLVSDKVKLSRSVYPLFTHKGIRKVYINQPAEWLQYHRYPSAQLLLFKGKSILIPRSGDVPLQKVNYLLLSPEQFSACGKIRYDKAIVTSGRKKMPDHHLPDIYDMRSSPAFQLDI